MSRKHYVDIAAVIAGDIALTRDCPRAFFAVRNVALSLSDVFKQDNARFDRERFLKACGLTADDAPMSIGQGYASDVR